MSYRVTVPVAAILIGCGTVDPATNLVGGQDVYLRIWAHSDIQPRSPEEKSHYETAVADMTAGVPGIRMAIVAGDWCIAGRVLPNIIAGWRTFAGVRGYPGGLSAGNHDQNDSAAYQKYTGKPLHYVLPSNMLIILMSDEIRSAVTDISDGAFQWWRDLWLRTGQNTRYGYAAPFVKRLASTINPTMRIAESSRFIEVLRTHPVDLWMSGHSHLPSLLREDIAASRHQDSFVDVSSIHKAGFRLLNPMYTIRAGSDRMNIMLRDHEAGRFIRSRSAVMRLRTQLKWDGDDPKIVSTYR